MKKKYSELRPDGNIPGLRVCGNGCSDQFDPYRLPAIQPDRIALRFPRPDTSVATFNNALTSSPTGYPLALEQGNTPVNGNQNELSP